MALKQSLLLLAVIVIAGCLGQLPQGFSTGINITSFQAVPNQVFAGEQVAFQLIVQNVGPYEATEAIAQLYGLSPDWTYPSTGGIQPVGPLTSGGSNTLTWLLNSPSSISTSSRTDYAHVRVYYKYHTEASATLNFVTLQFLQGLNNQTDRDQAARGAVLTQQSTSKNSPITVNFSIPTSQTYPNGVPQVVQYENQPFSFYVTVTNIGQGAPLDNGSQYTTSTDFLTLAQTGVNNVSMVIYSSLPDQSPGPSLYCYYLDPYTTASSLYNPHLKILSNNQIRISCQIYVSPSQISGGQIYYHISVELGYGYYLCPGFTSSNCPDTATIVITKTPF